MLVRSGAPPATVTPLVPSVPAPPNVGLGTTPETLAGSVRRVKLTRARAALHNVGKFYPVHPLSRSC